MDGWNSLRAVLNRLDTMFNAFSHTIVLENVYNPKVQYNVVPFLSTSFNGLPWFSSPHPSCSSRYPHAEVCACAARKPHFSHRVGIHTIARNCQTRLPVLEDVSGCCFGDNASLWRIRSVRWCWTRTHACHGLYIHWGVLTINWVCVSNENMTRRLLFIVFKQRYHLGTDIKSPLLGVHEYIVEELSGEFVAVFINLELLLSTDPARLTKNVCTVSYILFLVN